MTSSKPARSGHLRRRDQVRAQTSYWLQWMAERGLHRMGRVREEEEVDRLIDAYAGIVWNTLYAPTQR